MSRPTLITGGAGFIGTNLAHRILCTGRPVLVLDNLVRAGVERNLTWLKRTHGSLLEIEIADVRDRSAVDRAVGRADRVVHLAAQVAVTTSLQDPVDDFDVNARGTLAVLDSLRQLAAPPPLLFTSTNKVYGSLGDIALESDGRRYQPTDPHVRSHGIDEHRGLDFRSPYGCSKGAADQYVLDFARSYGLEAAVFRMSCVYGPHQCGTEDQGWVAHFMIRALQGEPITLYGDGHQVRDILFVEDLIDAVLLAFDNMSAITGCAFNIGGGPARSASLLEVVELITQLNGEAPDVRQAPWRQDDQRYYVSDSGRFSALTGWRPRHEMLAGLRALHSWLRGEYGFPSAGTAEALSPVREQPTAAAAGEL
jgi:CDP-paratose 2-epimerase